MSEDDHGALLDARARRVAVVLEAFYEERERARAGGEPRLAPFEGDDVIFGQAHVTVGDWLVEAVSSGATALSRRETIAEGAGPLQDRIKVAHFTTLCGLSTIGALEAVAALTGKPPLADRQWVLRSAAREAAESWEEMRDERDGLEYAIASWLTLALHRYLTALEKSVEIDPTEIAKWLITALAWTAGELAVANEADGSGRLAIADHPRSEGVLPMRAVPGV